LKIKHAGTEAGCARSWNGTYAAMAAYLSFGILIVFFFTTSNGSKKKKS